jgi:dTDP-4-amino-4,6-dideoxygalactose transaminase
VTEALAAELLSLPIYPGMAPPQVDAVVRSVREYFGDA